MTSELWHHCCERLSSELPEQQYNTWIRPLPPAELVERDDGLALMLTVPNRFKLDWIRRQYGGQIEAILGEITGEHVRLELVMPIPGTGQMSRPVGTLGGAAYLGSGHARPMGSAASAGTPHPAAVVAQQTAAAHAASRSASRAANLSMPAAAGALGAASQPLTEAATPRARAARSPARAAVAPVSPVHPAAALDATPLSGDTEAASSAGAVVRKRTVSRKPAAADPAHDALPMPSAQALQALDDSLAASAPAAPQVQAEDSLPEETSGSPDELPVVSHPIQRALARAKAAKALGEAKKQGQGEALQALGDVLGQPLAAQLSLPMSGEPQDFSGLDSAALSASAQPEAKAGKGTRLTKGAKRATASAALQGPGTDTPPPGAIVVAGRTIIPAQASTRGSASGPAHQAAPAVSPAQRAKLNPNHTFDTLVPGRANQMARTAALHVAGAPGQMYNPLFIYGGVGLGKTHLMHSVGNALLADRPDAKVLYLHAEQFISDVVKNYQRKTFDELKAKYHQLDLLLIDDVQFFAGKDRTQEEFFNAFEALLAKKAHIIMTSDTYPKGLVDIDERLTSRFDAGLTVAIEPPELEMRVAILMKKAEAEGTPMPEDVAFFIAKNVRANVRELEGALRKVLAYSRFSHKDINIQLARDALKDLLSIQNRQISVENIQKTVADFYKIKVADMYSKKRPVSIARPRQIAMYLAKELTQKSLPEIGELFGGRDHTTVLHAVRKISGERQKNTELNQQLHVLEQTLKG